jgi:hypothetical protein
VREEEEEEEEEERDACEFLESSTLFDKLEDFFLFVGPWSCDRPRVDQTL